MDVSVRVVAYDGVTELVDFNDHAEGLFVEAVQDPEQTVRAVTTTAARVDGEFRVSEADAGGVLEVRVRVEGSSWAECVQRWEAARAAYRSESYYFVEKVEEGVTTRWRAYRPNVTPGPANLVLKRQTYVLRFDVQPNPSVTV